MGGFALEVLTRLTSGLFAGLRFVEARSSIRARGTRPDVEVPERDRSLLLASLGPHVQVDTRGSTFYPTRGALVDVNAAFYGPALGGSRAFQSYAAGVNACVSTGTGQVLAMRLSGCAVKGDAPFHSLCLFGTHADLRGYETGQYRDRAMFAAQAEHRIGLPERLGFLGHFGLVAFGGVARDFGSFGSDGLLPAGGVGLRYLLSRSTSAWERCSSAPRTSCPRPIRVPIPFLDFLRGRVPPALRVRAEHAGRSVHGIRVAHPPPGSRQAVVPHRRGGQASSTSRSAWRSDPGWIPRRRPVCLLYDRGRDVLTGTYFLALQQQTFDVEFVRR